MADITPTNMAVAYSVDFGEKNTIIAAIITEINNSADSIAQQQSSASFCFFFVLKINHLIQTILR